MLQITKRGTIVTPDPENYYSINVERAEVAHMIDGKINSYINGLTHKELQIFIALENFENIESVYKKFDHIRYTILESAKILEMRSFLQKKYPIYTIIYDSKLEKSGHYQISKVLKSEIIIKTNYINEKKEYLYFNFT